MPPTGPGGDSDGSSVLESPDYTGNTPPGQEPSLFDSLPDNGPLKLKLNCRTTHGEVVSVALAVVFLVGLGPVVLSPVGGALRLGVTLLTLAVVASLLARGSSSAELIVIIAFLVIGVVFMAPGSRGVVGLPIFNLAGCVLVILSHRRDLHRAFDWFSRVLVLLCLPGILQYAVYLLTGELLGEAYGWVSGGTSVPGSLFLGNVVADHLVYTQFAVPVYRFQGVLNEPGLMGTVCGLLIAFRRGRFWTPFGFALLCLGLASLSLAFISLVTIFLIGSLFSRQLSLRAVASLILGGILFVNAWRYAEDLPLVSRIAGVESVADLDNRTSREFDAIFTDFIRRTDPWLLLRGNGNAAHTTLGTGLSSWKSIVFNHGLLGLALLVGLVLLMLFVRIPGESERKRDYVLFVCLVASLYQRPDVMVPFYFGILVVSTMKPGGIGDQGVQINRGTVAKRPRRGGGEGHPLRTRPLGLIDVEVLH